jgi:hypothetical protein
MPPDELPPSGEDRDLDAYRQWQAGQAPAAVLPAPARTAGAVPLRARYLALGLVMGGVWAWNGGTPLWVHAVKLVVLMIIVTTLMRLARRRRARRSGVPAEPRLSLPRTLGAKAALVVAALAANWLLDRWVPHAYLLVGAGLAVIVALLGPRFHPRLLAK